MQNVTFLLISQLTTKLFWNIRYSSPCSVICKRNFPHLLSILSAIWITKKTLSILISHEFIFYILQCCGLLWMIQAIFYVTVFIFVKDCICLLNSFSFPWKNSGVSQLIQHALFQNASLIFSVSCHSQPNFRYEVNIVDPLIHQHHICKTERQFVSYFLH
jgi:hypothetical protein